MNMYRISCLLLVVFIQHIFCSQFYQYHDDDDSWPSDSSKPCSQDTKQKAMYGRMMFNKDLDKNPFREMSVIVEMNDIQFAPHNTGKVGGFYVAYTTGYKDGPGGYFGVQMSASGGQFIFSFWDSDRWTGSKNEKEPKPSNKLTWPMNFRCKRNCQDCAMEHLREWKAKGLTTGTQCIQSFPITKGSKFKITLKRLQAQRTVNTKYYQGGMPDSHADFGEVDRDITGSVWIMQARELKRGAKTITIGLMMVEGDQRGMNRLGTFDEMLGCNKCNAIYHRDTRSHLQVVYKDGKRSRVIKMEGKAYLEDSTCKDYSITANKKRQSITFQGGPRLRNIGRPLDGNNYKLLWS